MSIKRVDVGPRMSQGGPRQHGLPRGPGRAQRGRQVGRQETKDILGLIDGLLAQAGTDKSKLLSANIWLTDIKTFDEMNKVWDAWVAPGNPPCRACVESRLAAPQYNVEIMVTAARD